MVILFWYKYKTIKYFLRSLVNLIFFLTISILRRVFLVLLVRVIVGFVFFPIRIIGEVFQIWRVTFLLTSYLSEYRNEYYRNRCYSLVIVLVNVYFYCHVALVFHQVDLAFLKVNWYV